MEMMPEKDVWKFSTTELGEQFVMTVSLTLRQRLLATHSASGILCVLQNASLQFGQIEKKHPTTRNCGEYLS